MTSEPIVTAARVAAPTAELSLVIPADLEYFDGHFPGAPIVPGVVQIGWALELASRYLDVRGDCVGMEALKFQRVMVPGLVVELTLRWAAADAKLHFSFGSEGARFGSGRLLVRAPT
jgi:3-hydroxymyristoyl/3-hydroxydecanoyl-(acyl carrier protein) dehydratase